MHPKDKTCPICRKTKVFNEKSTKNFFTIKIIMIKQTCIDSEECSEENNSVIDFELKTLSLLIINDTIG